MPYVKLKTNEELEKEFGGDFNRDGEGILKVSSCTGDLHHSLVGKTVSVKHRRAGCEYWSSRGDISRFISYDREYRYPAWSVKKEYDNVGGFAVLLDGKVKGLFSKTKWRDLIYTEWTRGFDLSPLDMKVQQFSKYWESLPVKEYDPSLGGFYVLRKQDKKSMIYERHCIGPYKDKPQTDEVVIFIDFKTNTWRFEC